MEDIFDQISLEESPKEDIFDQLQYESPTPLKEVGRHLARSGSRVVESLLGLPSDILQTAQMGARGLEKGASKIRESIGLEPLETEEKKKGFPGSSELKDLSRQIFGEIVSPQNEKESFIDDIVSDAAVLAIPVKGKIPFLRSIGTSVAGNLAQEAAKRGGLGEKGQTASKIGAFFLSGLTGKGSVKKYWNQQYKLAQESLPEDARISTRILDKKLRNFQEKVLDKGGPTPSKKRVKEFYESLKNKTMLGDIDVDELTQFKHDLNQNRASLYDKELTSSDRRLAKKYYNEIGNAIESQIEQYGRTNPKFLEHWKNAQEAFGGFYQSKKVGNWVKRLLPVSNIGKAGLILAEALFKPSTLPLTTAGYGAFKGAELATRIARNPTLRRYYGNLMKDAIKENKSGFLKNLKGLHKEAQEKDPDLFDLISRSDDNSQKHS